MIHLHVKSHYSLLESSLRIEDIIRLAKENGQSCAVLSDHRTMYGTMAFFHACQKAGLKPMVGLEFEVRRNERIHPLLLIAKNTAGLQNLYALSTRLCCQDAVLPFEDLRSYTDDCVLLFGGGDDLLRDMASVGDAQALQEYLSEMRHAAKDAVLAISLQDSPVYANAAQTLRPLAQSLNIPAAALSMIEYETPEDEQIVRLLQAIDAGKSMDAFDLPVRKGRYYRSLQQMETLYTQQELAETDAIAARVEAYDLPKASLPVFVNKANVPSAVYLHGLCKAGLKKRAEQKRLNSLQPYLERLEYELNMIIDMGFADYFLIVWDFIREARSRGILVGPGRGSAAGSLVAWCLGIANVDPIANGLLFERFLNPERVSMPDIDTDFPDDRRDEIIEYVHSLYGDLHAAHIVTFARMKARMVLRDTAKALSIPMREAEKLSSLLPKTQSDITLSQMYERSEAFASLVRNNPSLKKLYTLALRIEGFPRHPSIHAGGIVLSRDSILHQAPLTNTGANLEAVQFTMEYLEELGLIKFDFLALRNLTMLEAMRQGVEARTCRPLDLLHLPLDDPKVYELLRSADTLGIFQLESAGIRKLIARYKPRRFEDIAAILALYRPGPMENMDLFLKTRENPQSIQSIHPLLDDLLRETNGIFLYQEQIMEASRRIGGFSLAQADSLRKAMSKKKREVMESWKDRFIAGAKEKNIPADQAARIFETMEAFADYGFNKSHSYAYGLVVYQMAWIKANFPAIFYTVCLNSTLKSTGKLQDYFQECRRRRIPIVPVSINLSGAVFEQSGQGIVLPLSLIKGLDRQSVEMLLANRKEEGSFDDPVVSLLRLIMLGLKQEQLEALIKAGALDETGAQRESMLASLDKLYRLRALDTRSALANAGAKAKVHALLGGVSAPSLELMPKDPMARLAGEKEVLGFYVSVHPAASLRRRNPGLVSLQAAKARSGYMELAGTIVFVREHTTKTGQKMAFVTLEDDTGRLDLAIMPRQYERFGPQLVKERMIMARVNKNRPDSAVANDIRVL